jgi:hypothetical protein
MDRTRIFRPRPTLAAAACALAVVAAGAVQALEKPAGKAQQKATDIRPGLWEFRSRIGVAGAPELSIQVGQVQEQLKLLPPDTRRSIEQQMAARGVRLADDGAVRSCITPAQASRDNIYSGKIEGICVLSDVVKTATTVTGKVSCSDPQGSGDFVANLNGPTQFSTRMDIRSVRGNLQLETDARWLADDCGGVAATTR